MMKLNRSHMVFVLAGFFYVSLLLSSQDDSEEDLSVAFLTLPGFVLVVGQIRSIWIVLGF